MESMAPNTMDISMEWLAKSFEGLVFDFFLNTLAYGFECKLEMIFWLGYIFSW